MPLNCNTTPRYRVKNYASGKRVRLAFCGKKVIEAKSINGKGKGWHLESKRHSYAKRFGKSINLDALAKYPNGSLANQVKQGIKVEAEHKDTYNYFKKHPDTKSNEFFKKIAIDHLKENSKYYTKLKEAKL